MIPDEVGWSKYKKYEGPFTKGTAPYVLPENPTQDDFILGVATATEGGHWNAVNMYDRCVFSIGLIQWCEAGYFLASELLGHIGAIDRSLLDPLVPAMKLAKASFGPNARGRWRFWFNDYRGEVDNIAEQRQLFLLDSDGTRGSWNPTSKEYAKLWAACAVNVLAQPETIRIQSKYTVRKKFGFAQPFARTVIERAMLQPNNPVAQAFIAAYLSYAGNNPTWANTHLREAMSATSAPEFTIPWFTTVLYFLTFAPRVDIYPVRYEAVRKKLKQFYGLDLPGVDFLVKRDVGDFMSAEEVQHILLSLGYELGNYGANHDGVDGVIREGGKTWTAISEFQDLHALSGQGGDKYGWPGPNTVRALRIAKSSLPSDWYTYNDASLRAARLQVHMNIANEFASR